MAERYEIPPERLGSWLGRWAEANAPVLRTEITARTVTFAARESAVVCEPPFEPLGVAPAILDAFHPAALLEHAGRDRRVGVLLVRLGGFATGIFDGRRLVVSKVGSRPVHGRNRAGGQSQRRFERRRGEQAREALRAAADTAARVLAPEARSLEALVLGGDRSAVEALRDDPRLRALFALPAGRFLGDVPDPRLAVLRETPDRFRATVVRVGAVPRKR